MQVKYANCHVATKIAITKHTSPPNHSICPWYPPLALYIYDAYYWLEVCNTMSMPDTNSVSDAVNVYIFKIDGS